MDVEVVRATVDQAIREGMARCHVPGAAVAVVLDGERVVSSGWGLADVDAGTPVSPSETRFCIASVTKSVTATAALQLVEAGTVDLDGDTARFLGPDVLPEGPPITLAQLLTHSAGLDDTLVGCGAAPGTEPTPLAEHLREHRPTRLVAPGRVFSYGNHDASLVGLLIERATGVPYARYVEDHVFGPLGMSRSAVGRPDGDLALPYAWDGERYVAQPYPQLADAPAGAVVSTADDMAAFLLAQLGHGPPILAPETLARMHAPAFAMAPGLPAAGLGFLEARTAGRDTWTHEGAMGGYLALLTLVPSVDLGVFVATNAASDDCDLPGDTTAAVVGLFPAETPPPPERIAGPVPPVAGRYRALPRSWSNFERVAALAGREVDVAVEDGTLRVDGKAWTRTGPASFASPDARGTVAFVEDPDLGWLMSSGLRTYQRIPWVGWASHQLTAVGLAVLLLLGVLGLGPPVALARRRVGVHLALAWALACAELMFVAVFLAPFVAAGGPDWVPLGAPWWWGVRAPLEGIAWVSWVGVALGALIGTRTRASRLASVLIAAAGLVVLGFVVGWDLGR